MEEKIKEGIALLKEKLNCQAVILFGSYERKQQRPEENHLEELLEFARTILKLER